MKRKRRWILAATAVLGLAASIVALTAKQIYDFGKISADGTADAAIVLGAAVWTDRPSPVFEERINQAIRLYRQKRVRKIILTGGLADGDTLSESAAGKRFARAHGVAEKDLLVENRSKSTYENLAYAKAVASDAHLKTFLIVSDPLHMRRAMDMAADLKMDARSSPTQTTRFHTADSKREFILRETYFVLKYRLYDRIAQVR